MIDIIQMGPQIRLQSLLLKHPSLVVTLLSTGSCGILKPYKSGIIRASSVSLPAIQLDAALQSTTPSLQRTMQKKPMADRYRSISQLRENRSFFAGKTIGYL